MSKSRTRKSTRASKAPARDASKQQLERDLTHYSATATLASGNGTAKHSAWQAYGAAASVALLASSGIEAAIIYSGPQNLTLSGSAATFIDLDGGGNDFSFYVSNNGSSGRIVGQGPGNTVATTGGGYAQRFTSGNLIGTPGSSLGPVGSYPFIDRPAAGFTSNTGFIGVQLAGGDFGWIQFHFGGSGNPSTVFDWAYDDSGVHIVAGDIGANAVPEPSTTMLLGIGILAMGATGLRALRRRKREAGLTDAATAAA